MERHLPGYDGGGSGGGNDPTLQAMFDRIDQQDARMRSLPELEQRRAAALAMRELIAEMDALTRKIAVANGQDAELVPAQRQDADAHRSRL